MTVSAKLSRIRESTAKCVAWLLAAFAVSFGDAPAQTVRSIPSTPSCKTCVLRLERVLTIEDSEPFWLTGVISLARDSRGHYHGTSFPVTPGEIHVLDAEGRRIGKYGGGEGRGPGEGYMTSAPITFGKADTAFTYDVRLRRFTVWSPSLEFVRSFNGPAPDGALLLSGELLIAGEVPTSEGAGWPLHVISPLTGGIIRSFGSDAPASRSDVPSLNRRKLAASTGQRFWAAHVTRYRIEQWDFSGKKLLELEREVDWFRPHDGRRRGGQPLSYVKAIWEDPEGMLWVLVQTPDRNHDANRSRLHDPGDGMGPRAQAADFNGLIDSIVEVIDPVSGRLVASQRFDENLRTLGNGAPIHSYREAADGSPIFDVYRLRLVR